MSEHPPTPDGLALPPAPEPDDPFAHLMPSGPFPGTEAAGSEVGASGAPLARPATSPSSIGDKPILDLADSSCPKCHSPLAEDAVVCVKCGYDLKANVVRAPNVGVDYAAGSADGGQDDRPKGREEFVLPGRGGVRPMLIAGAVLAVGALVATGIGAGQLGGSGYVVAKLVLMLYQLIVNSATGIVAVMLGAWVTGFRVSRYELAGARMFVVTSSFLLVTSLWIPGIPVWISRAAIVLAGGFTYWLLVMILFKKDRQPAAAVMVAHAILWFLLSLGMTLAAGVEAYAPASPAATP